jgi:FKBP-type peptidyl-prolyl cis-trans isomerase
MKRLFFKSPITLCVMAMLIGLTSCLDEPTNGEDPYKRLEREKEQIDLALEGIPNVIKDPSGIRIVVHHLGTGLPAVLTNKIDVDYTGRLFTTGDVFDEGNTTEHESYVLGGYIDGWKLAFSILPVGTIATLYIPSGFGYGNRANGDVPANSILEFDVEFNDIIETSTETNRLHDDILAIDTYLAGQDSIVNDSTGLRYKITKNGVGPNASWFDGISMTYKIYLLSNDATPVITVVRQPSEAFASRLVDYINGMKVGLSKMNNASKATLYIPSGLAFGPNGATNAGTLIIPGNSNIIVEVEVTGINYNPL